MPTFVENLKVVESNIQRCCEQSGRTLKDVRLLAVSKTVTAADISAAAQTTPQKLFGENRADALSTKAQLLATGPTNVEWHFIGNIQTNKLSQIVPYANLIHSVSSSHAIREIAKQSKKLSKQQSLLLEINTSGELSKTGADPADLPQLITECNLNSQFIRLCGLMTMAPQASAIVSQQDIEQCFANLRKLLEQSTRYLADKAKSSYTELSMGMSGDYELAIAQGATIIRIGTALWR